MISFKEFIPSITLVTLMMLDSNSFAASSPTKLPLLKIHCGEHLTHSAKLANDLSCPEITDAALFIIGDNIKIDGNGHSISAPQAQSGIYAHGSNLHITGIEVNGIVNGSGILAYDCPKLVITGNDFSKNNIGIDLYAGTTSMTNVQVVNNEANSNSLFGVRASFNAPGTMIQPHIANNDLGNSGTYALSIKANSYEIDSHEMNQMSFSVGGMYLEGGIFLLHDFSLTEENIQKIQIFISDARSVTVKNVDLSTNYSHHTSDEAIGLDLYRAEKFDIFGLKSVHNDVGLKLETEKQVSPSGRVRCSIFVDNFTSGVMVSSYDRTPYGPLFLDSDSFSETIPGLNLFVQNDTPANPEFTEKEDCNANVHK